MESQREEVRVLMVAMAMQGHLNPMLRFAKLLVSKGVHVTLATTEVALQSLSVDSRISNTFSIINQDSATPKTPRVHLEFFSDGLDDDFDRKNHIESFLESIQTKGSRNLSNLITNLESENNKFSCIITNPFTPWVVAIALEHDIPCAMLWIQSCTIYSLYYHFFKHPQLFPPLEDPNNTLMLPAMPVLQVKEIPSFILPSKPEIFKKMMADLFQRLDKIKWVLGNSFKELEEDVVASMASLNPIIPVGPLVSPCMLGKKETVAGNVDIWNAEDSCIEWLDKKPFSSVIYISFGSLNVLTQDQMDSVATALKNSNRPFLWVIKPPAVRGSDDKKFCELKSGFLEETKERGLVVKWCSQDRVLMHPSVACFMTHCGWNSTLETVVAGVPIIAYPEWTDQPLDAKLLVDVLKIGVKMRINGEDTVLSAEEVERCITEVTEGLKAMEMKRRAVALKEAAKKAVEDGGSIDQNMDRFISELKGICR
ncbi:hypothetical protein ACOSQ3_023642 [Xanthoceras sorbifolium]